MRCRTFPAPQAHISQRSAHIVSNTEPDLATCVALLRSYTSTKSVTSGHLVHDHIIKCALDPTSSIGTLVLHFYLKCSAFDDALRWFMYMPVKVALSYNLVLGACVHEGQCFEALRLYNEMQRDGVVPDQVTFIHVLSACTTLDECLLVYESIKVSGLNSDTNVGTALVTKLSRLKNLKDADVAFDNIEVRNVVSWNAMISACSHTGQCSRVFSLFYQILQEGLLPDRVTFINIFTAQSAQQACLRECKIPHAYAAFGNLISDNVVLTALLNMYGKCGYLHEALTIFKQMEEKGIISWNAMIALYGQWGLIKEAIQLLDQLCAEGILPDHVTFISLLDVCDDMVTLLRLHLFARHSVVAFDVALVTSLLNSYGKLGELKKARLIFDGMKSRNIVSWNVMIAAYVQHACVKEVCQLFHKVHNEALLPNKYTFLEIFSACSSLALLAHVKRMHVQFLHSGLELDDEVGSAIIGMYGKCGSVHDGQSVFDKLESPKTSSFNALIGAYAYFGNAKGASHLFGRMNREGVVVDDITFISVLAACSRGGVVEEGYYYLVSMHQHAVIPTAEHYDSMIDLLCRAALFEDAWLCIRELPCEPTIVTLTSLLCAYGNWLEE